MEIENLEGDTQLEREDREIEIRMCREPYLGGGGSSYTAGFGIDIEENEISVDTNEIQEKLIAGNNITIDDNNVISSYPFTILSQDDYNYPEDNPDGIALWSLPTGSYYVPENVRTYVTTTYIDNSMTLVSVNRLGDNPLEGYDLSASATIQLLDSSGKLHINQVVAGVGQTRQKTIVLMMMDVIDSLDSSESLRPLSANQGKILKGLIDNITIEIGDIENALHIINNGGESE